MSSNACVHCGNQSLVVESHFTQEHVVCTECGTVASEGSFQHDDGESSTFSSALPSTVRRQWGGSKKKTVLQKATRERLLDLAGACGLTRTATKHAEQLLAQACKAPAFCRTHESKKLCLAGSCVKAALGDQQTVAPQFIANYLSVPKNDLLKTSSRLSRELELTMAPGLLEERLPVLCRDLGMDTDEVTRLKPLACQLVRLCQRELITVGVNVTPFLTVVVYVASCCTTRPPRRASFKAFCKRGGNTGYYNTTANYRLREIWMMLTELGKKAPWLDPAAVSKDNIVFHVEAIVKYQRTLTACWTDGDPGQDLGTSVVSVTRPRSTTEYSKTAVVDSAHGMSTEELCSEQLSEKDVADDDLAKYIRSPEEVKSLVNLKQRFSSRTK